MVSIWDGVTTSQPLNKEVVRIRHQLADAAKIFDWNTVFSIVEEYSSRILRSNLINATRLNSNSLYTPLHQAAYEGAKLEIVEELLAMGAWRTITNRNGEKPLDIAKSKGHVHLYSILEPVYKRQVGLDTLNRIQIHFHATIQHRIRHLLKKYPLRLPELVVMLELEKPFMRFYVPGMYGGFHYILEGEGKNIKLLSESYCRVAEGSGQRHQITANGSKLIEQGFI